MEEAGFHGKVDASIFFFIERGFQAPGVFRGGVRDPETGFHEDKKTPRHLLPLEGHSWSL